MRTGSIEQWPWFIHSASNNLVPLGDDPYNPPPGSSDSPSDSERGGKWVVLGNSGYTPPGYPPNQVHNVLIENLTVDGNWEGIPIFNASQVGSRPANQFVALLCIACIKDGRRATTGDGGITYRNVTVTGFYGKQDSVHGDTYGDQSKECFAMTIGANPLPMDPQEIDTRRLSGMYQCTAHGGSGDYSVGIALAGPGIIDRCHIYSLANQYSSAIQVFGNDLLVTNNIVRDCHLPFYADTGNIVNLLMEGNQFNSNSFAGILTNSTNRSVWINVRQNHIEGNPRTDQDFDGVFIDIPIRPLTGSGAGNPLYRIRVWFSKDGSMVNEPPPPAVGERVICIFHPTDTLVDNDPPTPDIMGAFKAHLAEAIIAAFTTPPHPLVKATVDGYYAPVRLDATGLAEWICHSKGSPFTSDESKLYIQSGWSWANWRIRNNYLEVQYQYPAVKQQYLMYFTGNGCTDSDYHIADNVAHFASLPPQFPLDYQSYSLLTVGIDNVTAVNNVLDTDFRFYGGIRNITKESSANGLAPATIQRLSRFGNRNLSGMPIPDLADDVHAWGGDQTLASGRGFPLSGKIHFADESDRANGILTGTGTGTDFLNELRPGDLVSTSHLPNLTVEVLMFRVLHHILYQGRIDVTLEATCNMHPLPFVLSVFLAKADGQDQHGDRYQWG